MAHYRAYLLDHDRQVISVANLQCADEQEARERAEQLVDANDIELWQLDRRIAVFKAVTSRVEIANREHRPPAYSTSIIRSLVTRRLRR